MDPGGNNRGEVSKAGLIGSRGGKWPVGGISWKKGEKTPKRGILEKAKNDGRTLSQKASWARINNS